MFKTIADVRRRAREAGCHFFDRDTMRFLASRVRSKLYAGRYFITSEGASFTVREAEDCGADGLIVRIPATQVFQQHLRIEYARKACRELARELPRVGCRMSFKTMYNVARVVAEGEAE